MKEIPVLNINPAFTWGIFLVVFIVFVILSLFLNYHWNKYGIENSFKKSVKALYWFVAISLFLLMGLSALIFDLGI